MRLLVIGGTGFVTGAIARLARDAGHHVVCATRTPPADGSPHVRCDATELTAAADALRAVQPDAVIHGVAYSRHDAEALAATFDDDTPLVVLSSIDRYEAFARAVRGEPTGPHPLREHAPRGHDFSRQASATGREGYDKNALVDVLVERAAVLHLPMVYGPADPQVAHRHGAMIHAALAAEPLVLGMAEAERMWTFGYVDDIAAACLHAVGHTGSYNVTEAGVRTFAEWAALYGARVERVPDPWVDTDGPQPHIVADGSAFTRATGFTEAVGAVEGARRTLAWHREHGIAAPDDHAQRQAALSRWRAVGP